MMEKLELFENNLWKIIDNINWYEISKLYSSREACDKVGEYCINYLTLEDTETLLNFIVKKREHLKDTLSSYFRFAPNDVKNKFIVSDDGLWDLSSHIVGLGKNIYYSVISHPEMAIYFLDEKVENFEYGFDKAIYEKNLNDD